MKLTQIAALFALFSMALAAPSAHAATYTSGDLFLGIRSSDSTQDYLIDIGPASQFTGQGSATNLSGLGNIKADLDSIFGSGWTTSANVYWSVSGGNLAADDPGTLYATRPRQTAGTPIAPWKGNSPSAQGVVATKFNQLASGYINGAGTANSNQKAVIQNTTGTNSYAYFQPAFEESQPGVIRTVGISFNYFNPTIEAAATGGITTTELELFKISPVYGRNATSLGVIKIDASGAISFTPSSIQSASSVYLEFDNYSGSESSGNLNVKVIRSSGVGSAVDVTLKTSNGSGAAGAVAGVDYQTVNTTVSFAASQTEQTVPIPLISRPGYQGNRTFSIALSGVTAGSVLVSPTNAIATIIDPDAFVKFDQATYSVSEKVDTHNLSVKVDRGGGLAGTFSVAYNTEDGTGTAGTDYTTTNGTLDFAANDTFKLITVPVADRAEYQPSRTFKVKLGAITAGTSSASTVAPDSTTVTIQDGDAGLVAFADGTVNVGPVDGNALPTKITLTLNRTQTTIGAVSVDVAVTGGTLVNGTDFDNIGTTTVTFGDGQSTATFDVQLKPSLADTKLPGTITLGISNPQDGASIGAQSSVTINVGVRDKVAPKVAVVKPKGAIGATVTLAGTASDDKGINRVEVRVNGGTAQDATLTGPFANGKQDYSLAGVQLENGVNSISVISYDSSGAASKATTLSLTYVNPQFVALAGAYNGLAQVAVAADRTHDLSGLLQNLVITKTGAFTSKLLLGNFTYTVSGIFRNNGAARFGKPPYTDTLALSRKTPKTPAATGATLALQLNLASVNGAITGSVTDDVTSKVAVIAADRALYTGKTGAALTKLQAVAPYINPATTLVGNYTALFQATNVPAAQVDRDAATFPLGDGAVSIVVDKNGVAKVAGKLADGQGVSFSAPLSQVNALPLFVQLYKKTGSISQKISFVSDANTDLNGAGANWFKPANAAGEKYYVAGWPAGITVDVAGAKYTPPPASPVFPGLSAGKATVTFTDGSLPAVGGDRVLSQDFTITDAGKTTVSTPNPLALKITVTKATGLFSGTFVAATGAKASSFNGAVLQKGPIHGGGFFLDPATQASPKSGGVSFAPTPP